MLSGSAGRRPPKACGLCELRKVRECRAQGLKQVLGRQQFPDVRTFFLFRVSESPAKLETRTKSRGYRLNGHIGQKARGYGFEKRGFCYRARRGDGKYRSPAAAAGVDIKVDLLKRARKKGWPLRRRIFFSQKQSSAVAWRGT